MVETKVAELSQTLTSCPLKFPTGLRTTGVHGHKEENIYVCMYSYMNPVIQNGRRYSTL